MPLQTGRTARVQATVLVGVRSSAAVGIVLFRCVRAAPAAIQGRCRSCCRRYPRRGCCGCLHRLWRDGDGRATIRASPCGSPAHETERCAAGPTRLSPFYTSQRCFVSQKVRHSRPRLFAADGLRAINRPEISRWSTRYGTVLWLSLSGCCLTHEVRISFDKASGPISGRVQGFTPLRAGRS
jgi:hypothetical protein